jgi:hypothetical protein
MNTLTEVKSGRFRPAAIVDNFFEEVLGGIFGRFFGTHRPWRWLPGGFFGGRGAIGKMG